MSFVSIILIQAVSRVGSSCCVFAELHNSPEQQSTDPDPPSASIILSEKSLKVSQAGVHPLSQACDSDRPSITKCEFDD